MMPFLAAAVMLHGVVVVQNVDGSIVVRHDAFGAMPAMAMPFRTRGITRPRAADRITASVDERTEPWTLTNLRVVGTATEQHAFVPSMSEGDVVPDVSLIDQDGKPLSFRRTGGPTIMSFIYTRCADARMCPLVTAKFGRLQTLLRGTGIRLLELTLDPAYDRPAILRRYADAVGANRTSWIFGTGRPADVLALAERFGILRERVLPGTLAHTEAVAIVSGGGTVERLIAGNSWSPEDVAAAARDVAALPSNPVRRFALALFAGVSAACGLQGVGGIPLLGGAAIFAGFVAAAGWTVMRLFAPALFEASTRASKRR